MPDACLTVDARPRTHIGVRSSAEVAAAVSAFGVLARPVMRDGDRRIDNGGSDWYLTGSPSMVKLGTRRLDTVTPLLGLSREEWMRNNGVMSKSDGAKRGDITYLSQKSRVRMQQRVCSLDYSPLFASGRMLPKMVTLTMPHDWERFAPDAVTFKVKLVDKGLKQKFRRHWGYDLQAVWKLEFQERKQCRRDGCHDPQAPHLHILMSPPSGLCPATGETFERWLRGVWSAVCSDDWTTFAELQDHRAKGVHISDTYGITGTDSKRMGDYFAKHGLFSDKEYQNSPPRSWMDENGQVKPGRYWGYWGLNLAEHSERLGSAGAGRQSDRESAASAAGSGLAGKSNYVSTAEGDTLVEVQIARILRRWCKANGKRKKIRLTVPDARREHDPGVISIGGKLVKVSTGEVLERRLSLWKGPFVGRGAGFALVNDGVQFMAQLRRAVGPPVAAVRPVWASIGRANALAQRRIDERRQVCDAYLAALGIITAAA